MLQHRGLAAMLAVRKVADVAPGVNLRNSLHAGDEAHKDPTLL